MTEALFSSMCYLIVANFCLSTIILLSSVCFLYLTDYCDNVVWEYVCQSTNYFHGASVQILTISIDKARKSTPTAWAMGSVQFQLVYGYNTMYNMIPSNCILYILYKSKWIGSRENLEGRSVFTPKN